jgi:hypothetical protein
MRVVSDPIASMSYRKSRVELDFFVAKSRLHS